MVIQISIYDAQRPNEPKIGITQLDAQVGDIVVFICSLMAAGYSLLVTHPYLNCTHARYAEVGHLGFAQEVHRALTRV